MLSFWERHFFLSYDYIILGSGITGLSTALSIREKNKNASILILERGIIPTGASTKNAGFACIGTVSEKLYDISLMGEEKFYSLIEKRWKGLLLLRKRLGDKNIDYQNNAGYELIFKGHESDTDKIDYLNKIIHPIFNQNIFSQEANLVKEFELGPSVKSIIKNNIDGQLNTGKMMKQMIMLAQEARITILTGAEVSEINEMNDHVSVELINGIKFKAGKCAVCTNAFSSKFFPEEDIQPGRGQVLATSVIPGLKIKGTFNFDSGFYYFRDFEGRIIFGGGRNIDFEKENTTVFEENIEITSRLEEHLKEIILPGKTFTIEEKWTGIMAFGKQKLPLIKRFSEKISIGARLNGMGVALGSQVGYDLAELLMEN